MTLDEFAEIMIGVSGKDERTAAGEMAIEVSKLMDAKPNTNNCTATLALIFLLEMMKRQAEEFQAGCEKARASAPEFMPN